MHCEFTACCEKQRLIVAKPLFSRGAQPGFDFGFCVRTASKHRECPAAYPGHARSEQHCVLTGGARRRVDETQCACGIPTH